jgi:CO dehydrogenase maturation factor
MKIAVSGKGGVGKTTIAANLAKYFRNRGCKVFAIDADPDSSLGLALGIAAAELETIRPVIELSEIIAKTAGDGAFYMLNPAVDIAAIIEQSGYAFQGMHFLRMGGVKPGGTDCYCRENTFLNTLVNTLILDSEAVVILDMGAGIEHLTRGTAAGVDLMLVVVEPGLSSIRTGRIVQKLARDIGIRAIRFIGNKIRNDRERQFIAAHFSGAELLGMVSYDETVAARSMGWIENGMKVDNEQLERILEQVAHYQWGTENNAE